MESPSIRKLIDLFSNFPTVGPRTASRFVSYLIDLNNEEVEEIIKALSSLKKNVKICQLCFKPFEPSAGSGQNLEICEICSSPVRDKSLLCIVAKETDLIPIEKTKKYQGLYFVLGGTISRLRKEDIQKLRTKELEERIKKDSLIQEIILATNPNSEGEATALYLERILKPFGKKITRLGRGLPTGGELEYADGETLSSALENRK